MVLQRGDGTVARGGHVAVDGVVGRDGEVPRDDEIAVGEAGVVERGEHVLEPAAIGLEQRMVGVVLLTSALKPGGIGRSPPSRAFTRFVIATA